MTTAWSVGEGRRAGKVKGGSGGEGGDRDDTMTSKAKDEERERGIEKKIRRVRKRGRARRTR